MNSTNTQDKYHQTLNTVTRFLRKNLYLILFTISFFVLFQRIIAWDFKYSDTDNYMRALRVYNLIINPSFFEQLIHQSNYPFGEINHWTRPMDIIWLLSTLPFLWLNNIKDSIFLAGTLINPTILTISVIAFAYGLRRQFNIYLALLGSLLLLSSNTLSNLSFYNPDHHSLMLLLGIYSISLSLCWLKKRQNHYLRLLGFSMALATFTAIEGIILYALFLSYYTYIYIFKKISLTPAEKISKYFAYAVSLFLIINPPYQGYLYPDNGRLSILFITLAWLIYLSLHIINTYKIHTRSLKIVSLFFAACTMAVILILIFSTSIIQTPLDAELNNIWAHRISEMQSIHKLSWDRILPSITIPAISILINICLITNKTYNRILTLNLMLGLPLFMLALYAYRFNNYAPMYSIIPYLTLIDYLYKKSISSFSQSAEFPAHIWAVILCIFLTQELIKIPYTILHQNDETTKDYSTEICTHLKNISGVFVTDTFISPQYLWYCNINTVATPYHRNREGIIDNHNILFAKDDEKIISLLLKHQVTLILVPSPKYDKKFYNLSETDKDKLYYRLINQENLPYYVQEIPLQTDTARLYKTKI